ncbi:hypothetical protein ACFFX0_31885 [Citricoccus parietis]|uniref:Uncharacterized protein n=1 Tax=Citricoccus parietis TaxID=592307 RepID=A0ABV5G9B3_9MICC
MPGEEVSSDRRQGIAAAFSRGSFERRANPFHQATSTQGARWRCGE